MAAISKSGEVEDFDTFDQLCCPRGGEFDLSFQKMSIDDQNDLSMTIDNN